MSTVLIGTTAGLATAFFWGTGDYLSARVAKKLSPYQINFAVQVVSLVMTLILWRVSGFHIATLDQLLRIIGSSLLITAAYLVFVKALSSGAVGIISPLANSYPVVTLLLSAIFLSIAFNGLQVVALLGIVVGAGLLAYEKNQKQIPFRQMHRETTLALIACVIWGVGYFLLSPVVKQVSWQSISIVGEPFSFVINLLLVWAAHRSKTGAAMKSALVSKTALLAGVTGMLGMYSFYYGSTRSGSIIIPAVLSGCGPLVASIESAAVDHEKIGVIKRVGAIIIVAGVVVLNLPS